MMKTSSPLSMRLRLAKNALAIMAAAPDRRRRRKALKLHGHQDVDAAAAAALKTDGYAPWQLSQTRVGQLLDAYRAIRAARENGESGPVSRTTMKPFFRPDLSGEDLRAHPVFLETALDPAVLQTIAASSGMVPHLEAVEVIVSSPTKAALSASQLWHRDVNDRVILKLFVYLSDVSSRNGPFTFIPAQASHSVPKGLGHYMADEVVAKFAARDTWRSVEGAAGSAFLIDTHACLHCGSRCEEERIAFIATYSSGLKFMAQSRSWQDVLGDHAANLSPLQRAVVGL